MTDRPRTIVKEHERGLYLAQCDLDHEDARCEWWDVHWMLAGADKDAVKHATETGHPVVVYRALHVVRSVT